MIHLSILEDSKEIACLIQQEANKQSDIECHHVYFNANDCLTFLPKTNTDLLLIDLGLPDKNGIDVILELKTVMPKLIFCVFTIYEDDDKVFNSIIAGANGYILKSLPIKKVIESIRELYFGGSPMSPVIARKIFNRLSNTSNFMINKDVASELTSKEVEILKLLSKGYLYKEIAVMLEITIGTVKQYIHTIYTKLDVSNRTEAINKAGNSIL